MVFAGGSGFLGNVFILLIVLVLKLMMNAKHRMPFFLVTGVVLGVAVIKYVFEHVGVVGRGFGEVLGRGRVVLLGRVAL